MRVALFVGSLLVPVTAFAHHSVSSWFDRERVTELEGELTEVRWVNPHVRFTIVSTDETGEETEWDIETLSVSGIRRWGITPDLLSVGDRLLVAGNPSKRTENQIFVLNVLLPSGEEIQFGSGEPRWSERALRGSEAVPSEEGESSDPSRGLFRVWSTASSTPFLFPELRDPEFEHTSYPLTAAARAALAAYNAFEDNPLADCTPKGMPTIMEQPYPMEFVQDGENILLHIEEYDLIRTIHMGDVDNDGERPGSSLGYSVGRWDGSDLVVTTTNANWGYFDSVGIPLSEEAEIVERFMPSEDGARLDYQLMVTDPSTFTEPVELGKHWIWRPEIEVEPYECIAEG